MRTSITPYPVISTAFLLSISAMPSHSTTLLFSDNFNVADSVLDSASTAGRTGTLASALTLQSALAFQNVVGNQLSMSGGPSGRIRFHETTAGTPVFNFAAGATGAAILAAGGMRFEFDFTPTTNGDNNWLAFNAGLISFPEPGVRIIDGGTDYGFGFRNDGNTFRFNNGSETFGTSPYTASLTPQHITIDLAFTSFADSSNVTVTSTVGSTQVDSQTFQWSGNGGVSNFEFEIFNTNAKIDNLSILTIPGPPEPPSAFQLIITPNGANYDFSWASKNGKLYDLVTSTDLSTPILNWPVYAGHQNIVGTAPTNTLSNVAPAGTRRFFAVIEK